LPTQSNVELHPNDIITPEELCAWLKVGRTWAYEKLRSKKGIPLPHIRMGRYLRFSRTAIAAWLEAQHRHAPKQKRAA